MTPAPPCCTRSAHISVCSRDVASMRMLRYAGTGWVAGAGRLEVERGTLRRPLAILHAVHTLTRVSSELGVENNPYMIAHGIYNTVRRCADRGPTPTISDSLYEESWREDCFIVGSIQQSKACKTHAGRRSRCDEDRAATRSGGEKGGGGLPLEKRAPRKQTETSKPGRRDSTHAKVSVAEQSTQLCKFGQKIAIHHVQGS